MGLPISKHNPAHAQRYTASLAGGWGMWSCKNNWCFGLCQILISVLSLGPLYGVVCNLH